MRRLDALTGGYHVAFLVGALFAIAAAATGALLLRTAPQSGAQRSGESRRRRGAYARRGRVS